MRFSVPQFIEHETKIVGPLTFRQFIFIGGTGSICFVLYFLLPFSLFLMISVLLVGSGFALAFLKVNGKPLPLVLLSFLRFSLESKIYIWHKKEQPTVIQKKEVKRSSVKKEEKKEGLPLKIAEKSRLKKLHTEIETRTK